jgi:hypothetical protein
MGSDLRFVCWTVAKFPATSKQSKRTLSSKRQGRAKQKPTSSLDAYDYYLPGCAAMCQYTRDSTEQAIAADGIVAIGAPPPFLRLAEVGMLGLLCGPQSSADASFFIERTQEPSVTTYLRPNRLLVKMQVSSAVQR